jgi:hypothetical protein
MLEDTRRRASFDSFAWFRSSSEVRSIARKGNETLMIGGFHPGAAESDRMLREVRS